jgi:hypothetical protein
MSAIPAIQSVSLGKADTLDTRVMNWGCPADALKNAAPQRAVARRF